MASKRSAPPPIVVLDANLLYPFQLRNLLVQFGVDGVIAPRWTTNIHEEWIGNLVAAGLAPLDRLRRTRDLMDRALPHADVQGCERHMDSLVLPDPDDRYVLVAALAAGAATILTMNLRDFLRRQWPGTACGRSTLMASCMTCTLATPSWCARRRKWRTPISAEARRRLQTTLMPWSARACQRWRSGCGHRAPPMAPVDHPKGQRLKVLGSHVSSAHQLSGPYHQTLHTDCGF